MSGLTLRLKVLILMSVITAVTLSALLMVAVRIFTSDKIADIQYSSAVLTQSLSAQVRLELDSLFTSVKSAMTGFQFTTNQLAPESEAALKQDSRIKSISVYILSGTEYKIAQTLVTNNEGIQATGASPAQLKHIEQHGSWVTAIATPKGQKLVIGLRLSGADPTQLTLVVLVVDQLKTIDSVQKQGNYAVVLVSDGGKPLFQNSRAQELGQIDFSTWPPLQTPPGARLPPGTLQIEEDGIGSLIASYASVGFANMTVLAFIERKVAMGVVQSFMVKSALVFLALLMASFIIASMASRKITSALSRLTDASQIIAKGEFNINLEVDSSDEIGVLARSFTTMAKQLKFFVQEVAEKAQLESELNTARTVQETLFPKPDNQIENFEISGYYEPASQCGGDWWYYSRSGDKILLWIGDATGHGVPAALLTSAARSAASLIELFPQATPGQALQMLNRAIHETSHGKLLMTFFLGSYDLKTSVLTYANASHEAPMLVRPRGEELKKQDLIFLNEVTGPRLGEMVTATYKEGRVELLPGDRLMFYTDGLSDLKNPDGASWGERRFLKTILNAFNEGANAQGCTQSVAAQVAAYRSGAKLDDDVTYFFTRIGEAA